MIRYALKCADDHRFESWFQSAEAYDRLALAGHVACAVCGSSDVVKDIMAPRVTSERGTPNALAAPQSDAEKAIAALREHVEENSTYVGSEFVTKARAMHLGDAPGQSIHGEAKPEDARKLLEDGVPVMPLPFRPKKKTN